MAKTVSMDLWGRAVGVSGALNRQITERVVKLEEELALARSHRFAPKSEKHVDCLFNEAEQVGDEDDADSEDGDVVVLLAISKCMFAYLNTLMSDALSWLHAFDDHRGGLTHGRA